MTGPRMTMTITDDHLKSVVTAAISEATKDLKDSVDATRLDVSNVHQRLDDGDQRMANIEGSIAKNSAETTATLQASAEMLEAFNFAKRGLAFIGACASFLGKVATWAVKVGLPLGAGYAAIKGWHWWPWNK